MANILALAKNLFPRKTTNQLSFKTKHWRQLFIFKPTLLAIIDISAICLLISQFNLSVNETYRIQEYQKSITKINRENNLLEIELSKINFLENINLAANRLSMEKSNKVYYLKAVDNQMAKK